MKEEQVKELKEQYLDDIIKHVGFKPTFQQCQKWLKDAADKWGCTLKESFHDELTGEKYNDCLIMSFNEPKLKHTHMGAIFFGTDYEVKALNMLHSFLEYNYGRIVSDEFEIIFNPYNS